MSNIAQIGPTRVVIGVDTHKDLHVAVALDGLGRRIDCTTIATTAAGYRSLIAWAESHGEVEAFGVEGTGSYGAGLARHLRAADHQVIEVVRPNRQARRRNGKSDPADAEAAARAVLSGEANGRPKSGDDMVEMIRVLRVARASAMKARTQALNALKSLVVSAPVELRDQLRGLSKNALVATAARLRSGREATTTAANKTALRASPAAVRFSRPRSPLSTASSTSSPPRPPPSWSRPSGSAPTRPAPCSSPRATTPAVSDPKPPSPCSGAPRPLRRRRARPSVTASTVAATARPTPRSTAS